MKNSHHAILCFAAISMFAGCAPTVSNDAKASGGETAVGDESTKPDPQTPKTAVEVAVGSVSLQSDCPDAPAIDPSVPASTAPAAAPAKRARPQPAAEAPADAPMRSSSVAPQRRRCQQSTLQITFNNSGKAAASVKILEVTLRDVETDQEVATLPSRKPSKWSDSENAYAAWDQSLEANSAAKASYRIKPPSWSSVEAKLDGKESRGRTYDVEVSLEIDGTPTTARSAEFTRPPIVPMPPT